MTTTAYDRVAGIVTSDSRWSCDLVKFDPSYDGHVLYVDDTGFGKLAVREDTVMVLAGNGYLIELWKKWLLRDELSTDDGIPPLSLPGSSPFIIYIIEISTNKVLFDEGHKHAIVYPETNEVLAAFSGSGGAHTADSWIDYSCAKTAIEYAKRHDYYTGGTTRYVDFQSGESCLETELTTIREVVNLMNERGYIMDTKKPGTAPVSISAQEVAHVKQLLANGAITPSAPVGKGARDWTDKSKAKLLKAIEHIRDSEAKRKQEA